MYRVLLIDDENIIVEGLRRVSGGRITTARW